MQTVALVVQVEGKVSRSGYVKAKKITIVTGFLLPMELVDRISGSELPIKQKVSSAVFLTLQEHTTVTPFING